MSPIGPSEGTLTLDTAAIVGVDGGKKEKESLIDDAAFGVNATGFAVGFSPEGKENGVTEGYTL